MDDALVERMARAMADAELWRNSWDGIGISVLPMPEPERNAWRNRARAALAIAEPAIREDEREACAKVADHHEQELRAKLRGTRKKRTDFDIGLFESAITEAASIAESIRARKGPRT